MSSLDKNKNEPEWLSEENDEQIRLMTTTPLMGTGAIDLADTNETAKETKETTKTKNNTNDKKKKYGSISTSSDGTLKDTITSTKDEDIEEATTTKSKTPLTTTTIPTPKIAAEDGLWKKTPVEATISMMKPHIPVQNACLWMFHLLEGIAVVASLSLCVTQILPLCFVSFKKIGFLSLALKIYISLFCLLFIITEVDVKGLRFLRSLPLLQTYGSRGFVYSFVGLICVEASYSERIKDFIAHGQDEFRVGWVPIFMQISSWLMLAIGVLYMLLGICCMQKLRDKLKQKEMEEWKIYRKAYKEWKSITA